MYDPNGQFVGASGPVNTFKGTDTWSDPSFTYTQYGGYNMQSYQPAVDTAGLMGAPEGYGGYGAHVNPAYYPDGQLTAGPLPAIPEQQPQLQ